MEYRNTCRSRKQEIHGLYTGDFSFQMTLDCIGSGAGSCAVLGYLWRQRWGPVCRVWIGHGKRWCWFIQIYGSPKKCLHRKCGQSDWPPYPRLLWFPGGAAVRPRCFFWRVRELYCLHLSMKEVSGNIFIYLNNFVVSEKCCGFVLTDSECLPENGRKPM